MTTDVSCATVVHPITKYADSGRTLVRILVVDDHDGMRAAVISELQSRQDFEICGEASNGEEAVQKAHLLLPDVIILDVMMPVKDGLTAAMEIRRGLPRTPILIDFGSNGRGCCQRVEASWGTGFPVETRDSARPAPRS